MASFAGEQGFLVRSRPHVSRRAAFLWGGAVLLWAAGVAFGMNALVEHEVGEGTPAGAPERWPASSAIPADLGRPTLVMLAHPQCPCTRASISELAILMAQIKGRRVGSRPLRQAGRHARRMGTYEPLDQRGADPRRDGARRSKRTGGGGVRGIHFRPGAPLLAARHSPVRGRDHTGSRSYGR